MMISKSRFFLLIVFISIVVVILVFSRSQEKSLGVFSEVMVQKFAHKVPFFDTRTFYEGIEKTKASKPFDFQISGGIIPHDYFVGFIIADFFKRLSFQKPKTIILLGPNHYEKGSYKALTSLYNWDTPFGEVAPDDVVIKALIKEKLLVVDEETLPNDHAISAITPFIKYYLPTAKIVPLLLSGSLTENESHRLADTLEGLITKDFIVIAAVDFSHYLTSSQAQEKDQITRQVISNFDYKQLYLLDNAFLDSPPSIGVLLMLMQNKNTINMDLLYHTDTGQLQNNNNIQTTSYYSFAFH